MLQSIIGMISWTELQRDGRFLGGVVGACVVLVIWLAVECLRLWWSCRRRCCLVGNHDDVNGDFLISYKAICLHLRTMLGAEFNELTVKDIGLKKCHDGYAATVMALAYTTTDMRTLQNTVRQRVQSVLDNELGLPGVFKRVDVIISGLCQASEDAREQMTSEPEATPASKPVVSPAEADAPLHIGASTEENGLLKKRLV